MIYISTKITIIYLLCKEMTHRVGAIATIPPGWWHEFVCLRSVMFK